MKKPEGYGKGYWHTDKENVRLAKERSVAYSHDEAVQRVADLYAALITEMCEREAAYAQEDGRHVKDGRVLVQMDVLTTGEDEEGFYLTLGSWPWVEDMEDRIREEAERCHLKAELPDLLPFRQNGLTRPPDRLSEFALALVIMMRAYEALNLDHMRVEDLNYRVHYSQSRGGFCGQVEFRV